MGKIKGRLFAGLYPNGTVHIVFIATFRGCNEAPLEAKDLDTAEIDFVRVCGLTPERAAELRAELERNKVVTLEISLEKEMAQKFCYKGTAG